ncbi:unnamed protein product, partial [Vitis vinifera]|uniref:Transmembrane protein n=1 Tax=Vitis vinifera TaxID=29760 RepID=D7UEA0_VITVI
MRKEILVTALAWLLVVAFVVTYATATDHFQAVEDMVHPQAGCRCCWFIWKPRISCGKACCGDGCCSLK